jgi:hypothetical protein
MPDQDLLAKLQAENARLVALLESHRIEWRQPPAHSFANFLQLKEALEVLFARRVDLVELRAIRNRRLRALRADIVYPFSA